MSVLAPPARRGLLLRMLPPGIYSGRASRLVERSLVVYSHAWVMFVSGLFEPLFYLLAFQVGFGKLVTEVVGPGGQPLSYVAFVAPALLASSAMNGAVFDSTYNLFFKLRYANTYEAMLATPIGPLDVALGEIAWAVLRGGVYAVSFLAVMGAMGLVVSWWALLMIPVALLIAFAFAAVGMASVTFLRSTSQFDYIQLALMPLFLFSTTFYPLSVYPEPLQVVVRCFPLYHGIELMRGLSAGILTPGMLGNVAYLVIMAAIGLYASARRIGKLLLT
ncbi:ABC transporter permease [Amycolatopsis sp. H20-H5]|uniref:ABC transporter permease n=1 Tax=Amycolatopsis sp. H20-H5 TaxID=3046309 RepID=UPI002DC03BBA|nr:ABC transporter permease [Amycolatopsis sp. H20-H5]MEC3981264.1 ABC transporter permease [Amycolatopsis sp. H20-H5]